MTDDNTTRTPPPHRTETINQGSLVTHEGLLYRVEALVDFESIIATHAETGRAQSLPLSGVQPAYAKNADAEARRRPIDSLDDKDWKSAWERLKAIEPLLEKEKFGRADVEARAAEVGCTANTLYNWLGCYRDTRDLTTLVPRGRGWQTGRSRITPTPKPSSLRRSRTCTSQRPAARHQGRAAGA